jgi:hypothetical protein
VNTLDAERPVARSAENTAKQLRDRTWDRAKMVLRTRPLQEQLRRPDAEHVSNADI